jgi:hypothetical protein
VIKYIYAALLSFFAIGATVNAFATVDSVAQTQPTIVELLERVSNEPRFTLIAALVLTALVYAFKQIPSVKAWLAVNPLRTRVSAVTLSLAPGLITIFTTHAKWDNAATAALLSFLASTGLDKIVSSGKDGAK